MFDVPDSKRVRREDLNSSASSAASARSSPDEDLTALFQARFQSDFQIEDPKLNDRPPQSPRGSRNDQDNAHGTDEVAPPEDRKAEEVEFRLFATRSANKSTRPTDATSAPAPTSLQTTKIRLESPEIEHGEGGLIGPGRPDSYYFADIPNEEEMTKLRAAALSGEEVKKWAKDTGVWEGCRLPWKVSIATSDVRDAARDTNTATLLVPAVESGKKKGRVGKKGRIARRKKLRLREEREGERKKTAEDREREEKEKRNRKNREKKIKRREKERAKKAAQKNAGDSDVGGDE